MKNRLVHSPVLYDDRADMFNRFGFLLSNRCAIEWTQYVQKFVYVDSDYRCNHLLHLSICSVQKREREERIS